MFMEQTNMGQLYIFQKDQQAEKWETNKYSHARKWRKVPLHPHNRFQQIAWI